MNLTANVIFDFSIIRNEKCILKYRKNKTGRVNRSYRRYIETIRKFNKSKVWTKSANIKIIYETRIKNVYRYYKSWLIRN